MLTHSKARSMAGSLWGAHGTTSRRTGHSGAFYFSCSGHGGFIIDDRAFDDEARRRLATYAKPHEACELYNPGRNEVIAIQNPFMTRSRTMRCPSGTVVRTARIWIFEEDCDWCLPVVFAGITFRGLDPRFALEAFARHHATSNHQKLEAQDIFARHFPDISITAPAPQPEEA